MYKKYFKWALFIFLFLLLYYLLSVNLISRTRWDRLFWNSQWSFLKILKSNVNTQSKTILNCHWNIIPAFSKFTYSTVYSVHKIRHLMRLVENSTTAVVKEGFFSLPNHSKTLDIFIKYIMLSSTFPLLPFLSLWLKHDYYNYFTELSFSCQLNWWKAITNL